MDLQDLAIRLGIPRPPAPLVDDVDRVLAWLPLWDEDKHPLTWTRKDAARFVFARWLLRHGRLDG